MAEEVEGELGLGEEFVPEVVGKGGVDAGKDYEEAGFEGTDGSFGGVAEVDI